jgi:hypothetical protein
LNSSDGGQNFKGKSTMSSLSFRSSRPDGWTVPKTAHDAGLRRQVYGRILPMEEPGFWARLFGRG